MTRTIPRAREGLLSFAALADLFYVLPFVKLMLFLMSFLKVKIPENGFLSNFASLVDAMASAAAIINYNIIFRN